MWLQLSVSVGYVEDWLAQDPNDLTSNSVSTHRGLLALLSQRLTICSVPAGHHLAW